MKIYHSTRWDSLSKVGSLWFPTGCLNTISIISFHRWCSLEGTAYIWMKSNLFWFVASQSHFRTSWHAKTFFDGIPRAATSKLTPKKLNRNQPTPDQKSYWGRGQPYKQRSISEDSPTLLSCRVRPLWFSILCAHPMSIISLVMYPLLGISVWIWTKCNLFPFTEGQTQLSTSWHAKIFLSSKPPPHDYLRACTQNSPKHKRCCIQKQPNPDQNSCWIEGWVCNRIEILEDKPYLPTSSRWRALRCIMSPCVGQDRLQCWVGEGRILSKIIWCCCSTLGTNVASQPRHRHGHTARSFNPSSEETKR